MNFAALGGGGQTFCINTLGWVLKQLDTLQEKSEMPINPKEKLWIRFAGGVYPVHATKELPGGLIAYEIEDTPGHFDLITKPEAVMTEQPVCEGLDEEVTDFINKHYHIRNDETLEHGNEPLNTYDVTDIARHFAQWQKEQMMKSPLVSVDCTASEELQRINYENGRKDMREQMLKEAVEGEVVKNWNNTLKIVSAPIDKEKFNFGDNVRIVIVKEEGK